VIPAQAADLRKMPKMPFKAAKTHSVAGSRNLVQCARAKTIQFDARMHVSLRCSLAAKSGI
jgi:hypothetical protein